MKIIICLLILSGFFFLTAKPALAVASFRLNPASKTININQTAQVDVLLDTGGDTTGAISVILSFDPNILSAGSKLTPGVFSLELVNTVDNSTGKIRFDAGSPADQNGSDVKVATINFSGKTVGTAEVDFTEVKAVNAKTNEYLVASSTGGSYTVEEAPGPTSTPTHGVGGGGPTSTPTPTVSPDDLPTTGNLIPTSLLLISGGALLALGIFSLLLY